MSTSYMIPTHNDPLIAVRNVINNLWEKANLEKALLPLNGNADGSGPRIINSPEQIQMFNPFTPLMPLNAAQMVSELVIPGKLVAAILRPCEIRTLDAMVVHNQLKIDKLLTISVDCLGTLPADEFEWRARRKGSPKGLVQESLHFARQGGIVPYRYRAACQICQSPEATHADINIGVIGLPVRQYLLIQLNNDELAKALQTEDIVPVNDELVSQHRIIIDRIVERGNETRRRIFAGLIGMVPTNIDSLIEQMQDCGDCHACLDACPISANNYPGQDSNGVYMRDDIFEWLISCSECGVCEQECPRHLPLTIIFSIIRNQLVVQ